MVRIDNESPSFTFSKKAIETNKEQQNNTPISVFGDKNNNGIIDSEDFSKEELEKLGKTRAFGFFENFKWSENISKIFSALLNNSDNGENSEGTDRSKERDRKENYFFRKYRKRKYKIY